MKITKCTGEGQGSCKRCLDNGKWNRMWMCFLYKIEDHKGTDFHFLLKPEDFGTEAFLTKEEAEQKLYDMPEVKCGECTVCDGSVYSMCFRKEDEGK